MLLYTKGTKQFGTDYLPCMELVSFFQQSVCLEQNAMTFHFFRSNSGDGSASLSMLILL